MGEQIDIVEHFKAVSGPSKGGFLAPLSCSVAEAEHKLGLKFPQTYVEIITDLREQAVLMQDIVEEYFRPIHQSWPRHLVPFFWTGTGDYYCFDARNTTNKDEHPVVIAHHDCREDENVFSEDTLFTGWVSRYLKRDVPREQTVRVANLKLILGIAALCIAVFLAAVGLVTVIGWCKFFR